MQMQTDKRALLRKFVTILFKRKIMIIAFFSAVVITVTVSSLFTPRVFSATCKIVIEKKQEIEESILFNMRLNAQREEYSWINSEIEIIKSYPVAARVVKAFGLDKVEEKNKDEDEIGDEGQKQEQFDNIVKNFQNNLTVINPRSTNIIEISYGAKTAELAAAVVNQIPETYINYRSEVFNESESYKFFEDQIKIADQKLSELEEHLASYKDSVEFITPEAQGEILHSKLLEYENRLTAVRTGRIGKEAYLRIIKEKVSQEKYGSIPTITDLKENPNNSYIKKLKEELLDMEIQRDFLLQHFKPAYEKVIELEENIASLNLKLRKEIDQIIEQEEFAARALQAEEAALQNAINYIYKEIKDLSQNELTFNQLNRGITDNQKVYSMLLKQREEARISLAKLEKEVIVKVFNPARVSNTPGKSSKKLIILAAIFLGLLGGVGLAIIVEYFDRSVNSVEELEELANLKIFGTVREVKNFKGMTLPKN